MVLSHEALSQVSTNPYSVGDGYYMAFVETANLGGRMSKGLPK